MKAISIWQPWASLIFSGNKKIETRSWAAPQSIVGQRIAIASTKMIQRQQRMEFEAARFRAAYVATGLPDVLKLPMGCVLGTVIVESCRAIDDPLRKALDPSELAFGLYGPGRFAWFLSDPQLLEKPVPVTGRQGLWEWQPG